MAFSNTYSFLDVQAAIVGPGGAFTIGSGSGAAEEGISYSKSEKNTQTIGADGSGMNSLHAAENGTITIRLLKTSPVNALLNALYQGQSQSSSLWGQNSIVISDVARGDLVAAKGAAFKKNPNNAYATNGNTLEWEFDCVQIDVLLGTGAPVAS